MTIALNMRDRKSLLIMTENDLSLVDTHEMIILMLFMNINAKLDLSICIEKSRKKRRREREKGGGLNEQCTRAILMTA